VDTPSLVTALDRTRRTRALVEELINDPAQLGPDFQPVRRLTDDAVVGWKATGRGRPGTELADTLALLDEAASLGLVERLDWAFRALVFDRAVLAGVRETVHLTPEPQTYLSACPPRLKPPLLLRSASSVTARLMPTLNTSSGESNEA